MYCSWSYTWPAVSCDARFTLSFGWLTTKGRQRLEYYVYLYSLNFDIFKISVLGAAFSLLAVFQLLATLIASIVFNEVYTPSSIDNNKDNPKLVYWMGAGIWALGIPLLG